MVNAYYPHLFTPFQLGELTLKSRLIASPISLFDLEGSKEHRRTERNVEFYRERAKGGAAIVTVGDSIVHPSGNKDWINTNKTMLCYPECIPPLTDITDEIHRYGAFANIELSHGGMRAAWPGADGWGVCDFVKANGGRVIGMSEEMIEEIVEAFGRSAYHAKRAGFDMVMIHAGHTWLLGQFLSPHWNHRTDRFGGSLENRARIVMMVIDRIRAYCGRNFPIEVRFSGAECLPDGYQGIQLEEAIEFAKMLDGKVDLLHVSAGSTEFDSTEVITHPSQFLPHGVNTKYARAIRQVVKTPVVTVGSITDPDMMEELIASGCADLVAVGRSLIADPELPKKARKGKSEDIRPCLRCFNCFGMGGFENAQRCSVNPTAFSRCAEAMCPPPRTAPQKVLIAGGGPAGMQAALTAHERGHQVILCESENELGGTIRYARGIAFKQDTANYLNYLIRQIEKSGIEVRLNTPVTPELVESVAPDQVIAAVGAVPAVPPIPGIEHAIPLLDAHLGKAEVGNTVLIIGGGLSGVEAAIAYAQEGRHPIVFEAGNSYAGGCNDMHRFAMVTELERYQIDLRLNTECVAVTANSVTCRRPDGTEETVTGDTVLFALGMKSRRDTVEALRKVSEEFQWIGDCRKPGQILQAVRGGYDAAMNL